MDFTRAEYFSLLAVMIAGATFALNAGLQLWGGGTGFQLRFTAMREEFQKDVATARQDYTDVFTGLRERVHAIELDHAKFARRVAEEYMRSPDFHREAAEIKSDMKDGFDKVDRQVERILNSIENMRNAGVGN